LADLPWGLDRHHKVTDFDGAAGRTRAAQIVQMAAENGFTQILGPAHLLSSVNDPWLRRDVLMMNWTADENRSEWQAALPDLFPCTPVCRLRQWCTWLRFRHQRLLPPSRVAVIRATVTISNDKMERKSGHDWGK